MYKSSASAAASDSDFYNTWQNCRVTLNCHGDAFIYRGAVLWWEHIICSLAQCKLTISSLCPSGNRNKQVSTCKAKGLLPSPTTIHFRGWLAQFIHGNKLYKLHVLITALGNLIWFVFRWLKQIKTLVYFTDILISRYALLYLLMVIRYPSIVFIQVKSYLLWLSHLEFMLGMNSIKWYTELLHVILSPKPSFPAPGCYCFSPLLLYIWTVGGGYLL